MPFDPSLPANNSEIVAVELRNQLNGLRELIDEVPVGPEGPQGEVGPQGDQGGQGEPGPVGPQGEQGVQGEQGTAGLQGEPGPMGPQGEQGELGPQGEQGPQGDPGEVGATGPVGPAFMNFAAEAETLDPGEPATATAILEDDLGRISLGIPRGEDGDVSPSQLTAAIDGTAKNPTTIAPLNMTVSNPPTQAEVQEMVDKLDALIGALTRIPA